MKSITFTVQVQADFAERVLGKTAKARQLCRHINNILLKYESGTGGAQLIGAPRRITIRNIPWD